MTRIEELLETRVEWTPDDPFLTMADGAFTFREVVGLYFCRLIGSVESP